jgi:predicted AlkP superfamily phosphohydrolase/phosphomutase
VNRAGREPAGTIRPGRDLDRFCAALTDDLRDLRYADTGEPVIEAVHRICQKYEGDYLDDLPDLVVEWADGKPLGNSTCGNPNGSLVRLQSKKIGIVEEVNTYIRTGYHRPEGMFVAAGPNIRPGRLGRTVSIMGIAPTTCAMLGTELPGAQGVPIRERVASARETEPAGSALSPPRDRV